MAIEIQLIPQAELATGQAAAIRNGAIAAVIAKASFEMKVSPDKLVVRDLQPKEDLDYSYATWSEKTGSSTAAYETMSSGTMADKRYVGIYGVKDSSEAFNVSLLRIKIANSVKAIWHLENLYSIAGEARNGFSPSVVVIPRNAPYVIDRYVNVANAQASIVLKAFVVEQVGKLLSP